MSAQNDLIPGLDISSLSSVTQAQLLQMIAEAAPLANIGLVVYGSTTPDVTNNPRFARYLWIDTSTIGLTTAATPKYYNTVTATWDSVTVPAGSIGVASFGAHTNCDVLDHVLDTASADGTLADKVLVYDSSGQFITQITKATLLASLTVNLSQLNMSGASVSNVIKNVAGSATWAAIDLLNDALDNRLPLSKLATGTTNYLLQMGATNPAWVSNDDAVSGFLPAGTTSVGIALSKLKLLGTALYYPRINAANNAWESVAVPVLQSVRTLIQGSVTGNTALPVDTSIPQYTEGFDTTLIASITPISASSILEIDVVMNVSHNNAAAVQIVAALFTGSANAYEAGTPNALAAGLVNPAQNNTVSLAFTYKVAAGSTNLRYYGVRAGTHAGNTVRLNTDGTNTLGGIISSYIRIREILA